MSQSKSVINFFTRSTMSEHMADAMRHHLLTPEQIARMQNSPYGVGQLLYQQDTSGYSGPGSIIWSDGERELSKPNTKMETDLMALVQTCESPTKLVNA
jgi:hypothetical protein